MALAQQIRTSLDLSAYPKCAAGCISTAYDTSLCTPNMVECVCASNIQDNIWDCVFSSCTAPFDILVVKRALVELCAAHIHNGSLAVIPVSWALFSIAFLSIVARFVHRLVIKIEIGWDDWMALISGLLTFPKSILLTYGPLSKGMYRDFWMLEQPQVVGYMKTLFFSTILYLAQTAILKLCFTFFYKRVFPSDGLRRLLWATIIFTATSGVACSFAYAFHCQPLHYKWSKWEISRADGSCTGGRRVIRFHSAVNIALDIWVLGIGLWKLKGIQLDWQRKLGVAVMLLLGTFVTVISVLHLYFLLRVEEEGVPNLSFALSDTLFWSMIEINVGIICCCLPPLCFLFLRAKKLIQRSNSLDQATRHSDEDASRWSRSKGRTVNVISAGGPNDDQVTSPGIVRQMSYELRYVETDEEGLITNPPK